jgi:hypothetical protein
VSPDRPGPSGRLIALEGTLGTDVTDAAEELSRRLARGARDGGRISQWDASGLFKLMHPARRRHDVPSSRTLLLLYAADLVFRLRWEITPALRDGRSVIAAPYLETAIAFGVASGIQEAWLKGLFGFAPAPHICYRVKERKRSSGWKGKARDGFLDFSSSVLRTASPGRDGRGLRRAAIEYLEAVEEQGRCGPPPG